MDSKIIKRNVFHALFESLKKSEVKVLLGARQTGKSKLIELLANRLVEQGTDKTNIFNYNFDDLRLRAAFKRDFLHIQKDIERRLGHPMAEHKSTIFLFLDEAQKAPDIFDWAKMMFEKNQGKIQIIITGSSALNIKKLSRETLAGRAIQFHLFPLGISEILETAPLSLKDIFSLDIKTAKARQAEILQKSEDKFNITYDNLITYGGLPRIFTLDSVDDKREALKNYISLYLEEEIADLNKKINLENFSLSIDNIASYSSHLLNINKIAINLGIARNSLSNYLNILQQTYLIHLLNSHNTNLKTVYQAKKVAFFDNGVCNDLLGLFSLSQIKKLGFEGKCFEEILLLNLLEKTSNAKMTATLSYFRDYQDHEIDAVAACGEDILPIEFTTSPKIISSKINNFKAFFKAEPRASFGIIIYSGFADEIKIEGRPILLLPWWMM